MKAMTVDELRELITHDSAPCISIYMPTQHGGGPEDRARFAGHVREARKLLNGKHTGGEVESLLGPVSALDTPEFWASQLQGLAVFRSNDVLVHYAMPLQLEPLTVVADSFHIRPVLHFLQSNQRFYLLNLSLGRVSFFKGSAMGLGPVEVPGLPRSSADVSQLEQHERIVQAHSASHSAGAAAQQSPMFHGQGKLENVQAEDVRAYFRAIDKALWEILRDETAPLVVAAAEEHHPIFASISRYPYLLHDGLQGNFNNTPLVELHAKAWPVVQQVLEQREAQVLEHYERAMKRKRASDDVGTIAAAAVQGRVHELMVARDTHMWGRMDAITGAIDLHAAQKDGNDDDVLDDIAEAVILRGGNVLALDRRRMPHHSQAAAVLRW